jgi:hypothetical protein
MRPSSNGGDGLTKAEEGQEHLDDYG